MQQSRRRGGTRLVCRSGKREVTRYTGVRICRQARLKTRTRTPWYHSLALVAQAYRMAFLGWGAVKFQKLNCDMWGRTEERQGVSFMDNITIAPTMSPELSGQTVGPVNQLEATAKSSPVKYGLGSASHVQSCQHVFSAGRNTESWRSRRVGLSYMSYGIS